jgi:alkaline phosphatase D
MNLGTIVASVLNSTKLHAGYCLIVTVVLAAMMSGVSSAQDAGKTARRVAIIGCHQQPDPTPALLSYVAAKPDVVLWVGDNVYADTKDDPKHIRACYDALEAKPGFKELRDSSTFLAVWDDHDYGVNDGGKDYIIKAESHAIFRDFWRHKERIPADRPGVFHSTIFGQPGKRLQVIMLDGRYNREDPGENADTLGEPQWTWLAAELKKPAELRFIISGYQFLLQRDTKFETWGKFPKAQARLYQLIRESNANGVVFIAGDQHYGEVTRVKGVLGYDAIELMFAGINQEEPYVMNAARVSPVANSKDSYAYVDIQWEATAGDNADVPHLLFRCFDVKEDRLELTYRVNFDELTVVQPTKAK